MKKIQFALLGLCLSINATAADTTADINVRKSQLAISAFECSIVASNDSDRERLFLIGLAAGREFLEFSLKNPAVFEKSMKSKIAILWGLTGGPTIDFVLGQIYADRSHEIYKQFSSDKEVWEMTKSNSYRTKNCALIGSK
jgi:hypothetical protein